MSHVAEKKCMCPSSEATVHPFWPSGNPGQWLSPLPTLHDTKAPWWEYWWHSHRHTLEGGCREEFWGKEVRFGTQVNHLKRKGRDVEWEGDRVGEWTRSWLGGQHEEQPRRKSTVLYLHLDSHVRGLMDKWSHVTTEAVTTIALQVRATWSRWQINLPTRFP